MIKQKNKNHKWNNEICTAVNMSVFCKCDNNLLLKCLRELSDRKKYGN